MNHQKSLNSHLTFINCLDTNRINNLLHIIKSVELKNKFEKKINKQNISIEGSIENSNSQGKSLVVYFRTAGISNGHFINIFNICRWW
jgi:hypothetical protein